MPASRDSQPETTQKKAAQPKKNASTLVTAEAATPGVQSAVTDPALASPGQVLHLQRNYGNRAVQRLMKRSELEQKAEGEAPVGLEGGEVSGEVQRQIDAGQGGGQTLDKKVGDSLGGAMGADFSNVRVHTDSQADTLNRSLSAEAFTTGSDIYFSQGAYSPGTSSGKELLAHELTHVVQQSGGSGGPVQTKLTVGPAGDKYEQEADDVASQVMRQPEAAAQPVTGPDEELGAQRSFIQRKSDKLKAKTFYTSQAKGGFKLIGTSAYNKVMNAIGVYQGMGGTDYLGQLQQLARIGGLLTEWEIEHGHADSTVASKNAKETARRGVLESIKTTDLPQEIADVYQQAKTNNDQVDIHLLSKLMDAAHGNPGVRGPLEADYATALRTYQAGAHDSQQAEGMLTGSEFMMEADSRGSLAGKVRSVRGMSDDPSDGRIDVNELDMPIAQGDSELRQQLKKARVKLRGLVPALANMSDIEIMAIGAYTDEGGYTPMNQMLRGGHVVRGGSKAARKAQAKLRAQVNQANLMAASALNKLPNWDGSPVYRGENISWLGVPTNGMVVVLKAFTSTAANIDVPRGFASKGGPTTSAVWEISGVTTQGKDISKLSTVQQDYGIGSGIGGAQEDEVLLKPYTRLRIDNVTQGPSYRYHIEATAL